MPEPQRSVANDREGHDQGLLKLIVASNFPAFDAVRAGDDVSFGPSHGASRRVSVPLSLFIFVLGRVRVGLVGPSHVV